MARIYDIRTNKDIMNSHGLETKYANSLYIDTDDENMMYIDNSSIFASEKATLLIRHKNIQQLINTGAFGVITANNIKSKSFLLKHPTKDTLTKISFTPITSIENNINDNVFEIKYDPITNNLRVRNLQNVPLIGFNLQVSNSNGNLVFTYNFQNENNNIIQLPPLTSGAYYGKLIKNNIIKTFNFNVVR